MVVMIAASTLISVAFSGGRAFAAQTAQVGGNALKVSPVRLALEGDPGTTKVIEVSIKNLTGVTATLRPTINDFTASGDESGRPNIILDDNVFAPSHSLKRMAKVQGDITLKPAEERNVKVTITIPGDAAGGGYYGAVRFAPVNPGDPNSNVNLSASVGSLVLLRVNGTITENMSIASFDVRNKNKSKTFFNSNKDLKNVIRFENTGNVQVEPFGKVTLKRFGKEVAQYEVNSNIPRGSVLPDSIRRFELNMDKLSSFGKFTLEGSFGYGTTGQLLTTKTTFYVIPMPIIIAALVLIAVIVLAIVIVPKMLKRYNRRVIRRATGRR
jgi:hypothetical protein